MLSRQYCRTTLVRNESLVQPMHLLLPIQGVSLFFSLYLPLGLLRKESTLVAFIFWPHIRPLTYFFATVHNCFLEVCKWNPDGQVLFPSSARASLQYPRPLLSWDSPLWVFTILCFPGSSHISAHFSVYSSTDSSPPILTKCDTMWDIIHLYLDRIYYLREIENVWGLSQDFI